MRHHWNKYMVKKNNKYWDSMAYRNKVNNTKQRGIEFNLSLREFRYLRKAKYCFYTGVEMVKQQGKVKVQGNSWTIDRVDDAKDYERGNVVACSAKANSWKNGFDLAAIARRLLFNDLLGLRTLRIGKWCIVIYHHTKNDY